MSFGLIAFTNRGRALQAKTQAGAQLNFTRIAVGDGQLSGQAIADLTALIHEVKSITLNKFKTLPGGKAVVGGVLSNQDIVTGFWWRELGLFATDPDLGEILYCYGNAGELAEYIPSPGGAEILEKQVDIVSIIGNAQNVSASIEKSLVYASAQELQDHENDAIAHVTQVEKSAWDAKETPAGAQAKANAAASFALTEANGYTDQEVGALAGEGNTKTVKQLEDDLASHTADNAAHGIATHIADNTAHGEIANTYRSDKDANGIFVTLEYKRTDGTLFKKSVLSGGTSPKYTTRTVTYYNTDGTTVLFTKVYTLTYTGDDLTSEVTTA